MRKSTVQGVVKDFSQRAPAFDLLRWDRGKEHFFMFPVCLEKVVGLSHKRLGFEDTAKHFCPYYVVCDYSRIKIY